MAREHKKEKRRKSKRRSVTPDSSDESDRGRDKRSKRRRHRTPDESDSGSDSGGDSPKYTSEQLKEYLAKKAQKKALKVAKKLKQGAVSGYTNDSNPFGDTNLTETFVWRKKIEKDVKEGMVDARDFSVKSEKLRLKNRMSEIEKVKKRREERLQEKMQHEEEMALLARERARAEFQDWEKKEEEFHFDQSKVRSDIRLREGRAKPIDILAKSLSLSDDLDGLTVKEMEDLRVDIKLHMDLDRETETRIEYWSALMVVCDYEIAEATRRDALDRARVRGEEPPAELVEADAGLHPTVSADIEAMLQGKDHAQLEGIEREIHAGLQSGAAKDADFFQAVLKRSAIHKAKAKLRKIHADLLRQHLAALQASEEQRDELAADAGRQKLQRGDWDDDDDDNPEREGGRPPPGEEDDPGSFSPTLLTEEEAAAERAAGAGAGAGAEAGSFSPELHNEEAGNEAVMDPEADRAELDAAARANGGAASTAGGGGEESQLSAQEKAAAMKMMGQDPGDAVLGAGAEVNLESQVYWWHDKYRPRKPKYFNRVHTGYEWNKYNQTHYDHDNPPPKIVQGYKFNIFYPDLIDKVKAPTYVIDRDGSKDGETCLIRFHAGPPYEDIAFRVVNKEWEYSHKKGFKCTFERGILHVYFNFKRYRYRR
eukprot:jgi/Mesen1/7736/ME000407S06954